MPGLAAGEFDPLSVVLCLTPGPHSTPGDTGAGWAWGLPDEGYQHRDGMITKAEIRAVALGKLRIPPAGVLWDVGAGSGSVAAECALRLPPGLRVLAIERRPADLDRLPAPTWPAPEPRSSAARRPDALVDLPDPDRLCRRRRRPDGPRRGAEPPASPGGTIVATYAAMDRATMAASRLGHMVQIAVSRAVPIGPEGSLRLAADNPVFICWGPGE